jgi:ABC-type uncharacterized transport system substrate-binding protein
MPKRLELLSDLAPQAKVIALLVDPADPNAKRFVRDMQEAALSKRIQLNTLKASTEGEIDGAFGSFRQQHADALIVSPNAFFVSRRGQLVTLASRHAVPTIYPSRDAVAAGGLISYGPSLTAVFRQLGIYVGKILQGENSASLPVQQPTKFELVVNLKTARELGLTIPPLILARADEVIE